MTIKVQIKNRIFSLDFGRRTKWFEQVFLVSLVEEYYDNNDRIVTYARLIWVFEG